MKLNTNNVLSKTNASFLCANYQFISEGYARLYCINGNNRKNSSFNHVVTIMVTSGVYISWHWSSFDDGIDGIKTLQDR